MRPTYRCGSARRPVGGAVECRVCGPGTCRHRSPQGWRPSLAAQAVAAQYLDAPAEPGLDGFAA